MNAGELSAIFYAGGDHGLASVRSRSHARVKSSPISERITVFNNFSFEKLRSEDANVTEIVRHVTRIFAFFWLTKTLLGWGEV